MEKNGRKKRMEIGKLWIEIVMSFPVTLESYISNVLSSLKKTTFLVSRQFPAEAQNK